MISKRVLHAFVFISHSSLERCLKRKQIKGFFFYCIVFIKQRKTKQVSKNASKQNTLMSTSIICCICFLYTEQKVIKYFFCVCDANKTKREIIITFYYKFFVHNFIKI